VVLSNPDIRPFHCLHALGTAVSFLTIDPRLVFPEYRCVLSPLDRLRLRANADEPLVWLSVVTAEGADTAWANLRAPVVINPAHMIGYQVVPVDTLYPLRHPLPMADQAAEPC
jgi:flagellar assembly factor FliW